MSTTMKVIHVIVYGVMFGLFTYNIWVVHVSFVLLSGALR